MTEEIAKRPCLLWIALALAFLFFGIAGTALARIIEQTALHQDQRHRLVAPIERTENA